MLLVMLLEFIAASFPQAGEAETSQAFETFSATNLNGSPDPKWFDWHDSTLEFSMLGEKFPIPSWRASS